MWQIDYGIKVGRKFLLVLSTVCWYCLLVPITVVLYIGGVLQKCCL